MEGEILRSFLWREGGSFVSLDVETNEPFLPFRILLSSAFKKEKEELLWIFTARTTTEAGENRTAGHHKQGYELPPLLGQEIDIIPTEKAKKFNF